MADDVLLNKAASIERCVARAREEYQADPAGFAENHTRQDAAILNIQRACEAALDMGQHFHIQFTSSVEVGFLWLLLKLRKAGVDPKFGHSPIFQLFFKFYPVALAFI